MRTPHSSCRKGKRVRIILRNGNQIIDKFKDKKSNRIILDSGEINIADIRAFSIYKPFKNADRNAKESFYGDGRKR